MEKTLRTYWIEYLSREGIFVGKILTTSGKTGVGVTAFSVEDAQQLLAACGHEIDINSADVTIQADIKAGALPTHVLNYMGPIIVRGVWYPPQNIGF